MRPLTKVNLNISILTISIMFLFIKKVLPVLETYSSNMVAAYLATLLASTGTYTILHTALNFAFDNFLWIKIIILGDSFIEGTWIGSFKDNQEIFYTIEKFEQTYEEIILKGVAYNRHGEVYATWHSTSVVIDPKKGKLSYHYECQVTQKNMTQQGIGEFTIDRFAPKKYPQRLIGFSADLIDGKRTINKERKESNELLEFEAAFQKIPK